MSRLEGKGCVNLKLYTDYGKIYNDVITNIATQTTPNVCITYPDHIATYLTGSQVVVPLDELMADPAYGLGGSNLEFDSPTQEEVIPQFLKECSLNGHYYALPYMRSTEACYINQDYVEQLGYTVPDVLTWDFIWEVSEAAAKKGADGKYVLFRCCVRKTPDIPRSPARSRFSTIRQRTFCLRLRIMSVPVHFQRLRFRAIRRIF